MYFKLFDAVSAEICLKKPCGVKLFSAIIFCDRTACLIVL